MHLIPPMEDEPPPEYVDFVAAHLPDLRSETARLVGGDAVEGEIYMDVLTDVAGHWRGLRWWGRLARPDAAEAYLRRRLAARTRQWREDQIYEVEMRVLQSATPAYALGPGSSLALRKAAVLPGTARAGLLPVADAGISWVHAYRRSQLRRVAWRIGAGVLLVGGMVQYMSWLASLSA